MHHHILGTTGQRLESDQLPIQPKFFCGVYGYSLYMSPDKHQQGRWLELLQNVQLRAVR